MSEGKADFAGDYAEHYGVLFEGSKAFQYLGPKVGYSANLSDAEYPYHFFCEPKEQADVIYARMEWLEL